MVTATQAIPQEQMQKWSDAVQEFVSDIFKKYPSLDDTFIPKLIEEVKALGLMREFISARALWGAFRNCCADGRIQLPPVEPTLTPEAIAKLVAKYPVVVTRERELTQRERSALAGVSSQSGRMTSADKIEQDKKQSDAYSNERNMRNAKSLKAEFQRALNDASILTGRTHSESANLRREATEKVMRDPRFASVR
jgi:hypothetical protein